MKTLIVFCLVLAAAPSVIAADNDPKDPATWTPAEIRGNQKAPEFADIQEWINTKPLTMAKLKGKVVVVHFLAFG
jgi:hypothetical protein